MSFWSWFGGSAAQSKDSPKDAIVNMREHLEMLNKRATFLQAKIDEEDQNARDYVGTKKNLALIALKKKKGHEKKLLQTHDQIDNLERQISNIEDANINMETLMVMQKSGRAMKTIQKKYKLEDVDKIMDELREQNELSSEISTAISTNQLGQEVDEDELLGELEELEQENLNEQMLKTGNVPVSDEVHKMPAVSKKEPVRQEPVMEDDEEAELRRLQAEMAM